MSLRLGRKNSLDLAWQLLRTTPLNLTYPPYTNGVRAYASHNITGVFSQNAQFLAAATSASSIPRLSGLPEVIVAGRANVGKSTLLNGVMQRARLVNTSSKPGRTKTLSFFRIGPDPGKLVLVDAPGYGTRGRPEWGRLFDQYLDTRQQLCRVYLLINAKHGMNEADKLMLQDLDRRIQSGRAKWTLQAIITKADLLPSRGLEGSISDIQQTIFQHAPTCLPAITTASRKGNIFGIDEVRKSLMEACGLGRLSH
ncbi:P-loop containing nucleoside triphosphate hydrolase protein [Gloeopeniophorella convolvens]|nr:P-loop containing nucleoside triphosphate hydrolase protein [Gloeopeniophorella convolvens]